MIFNNFKKTIQEVLNKSLVKTAEGKFALKIANPDGTPISGGGGGGTGDVVGPGSSTDNAVSRFNGTTGKSIQNSLVTVDDNGSINIPSGQSFKINNTALAKGDIGLGNVDNLQQIPLSQKGAVSGVAELDVGGKVPTAQLPSLLALGETSDTAYRGDRGKTGYDHSQVSSGNPHGTTKSDISLGNVLNLEQIPKENFIAKSANFNVDGNNNTVYNVTTGSSTITATFSGSPAAGDKFWFRKVDAGTGKVVTSPATDNELFSQDDLICVRWNGTAWKVISKTINSIIDIYLSSSTWNKRLGLTYADFHVFGGGGGGGSGRRGATSTLRYGGNGGWAGGYSMRKLLTSILGSSETITIGAGGTGGAGATSDNLNGNAGTNGGDTSVGTLLIARGGKRGAGGTGSGPGVIAEYNGSIGDHEYGSLGGVSVNGNPDNQATSTYQSGARATAGGGGGSGGTISNLDLEQNGGTGATSGLASTIQAGGAYGVLNGARNGSNGSDPTISISLITAGGGGGGGASELDGVNAAGDGGTGGKAAGGGGGGASTNGANSGTGGTGGNGFMVVINYFM